MSSNFIIKILILFSLIFTSSCQDSLVSFNSDKNIKNETEINYLEENDQIDLSINTDYENNFIDYYSNQNIKYNFLNKELEKIKINNFESKIINNLSINVIYIDKNLYSINSKGEILQFEQETGKLINRYKIDIQSDNKIPVSFSLVGDDFIIGFNNGQIIRTNKLGEILWSYKKDDFLNTPIKYYNNHLIILYPESIVILSPNKGEIIFEKNYISRNIIQSTGGKIINYFNLIYFILPNSEFHGIDTFLLDEHISQINNIEINTSLNNLNDKIHIYKNFLLYLDDGSTINTFDLNNNNFLVKNYRLNDIQDPLIYNNTIIAKSKKNIYFYNIKNGNLFFSLNVEKILNKDSKVVKVTSINNKLHLFTNYGKLLILDNNFEIEDLIDLKIRNINKIFIYQDKIFISTEKGTTYIF